jgi:hypothetical protein
MLNEEKTSLLDAVRLFSIEKEEPEWMRNNVWNGLKNTKSWLYH